MQKEEAHDAPVLPAPRSPESNTPEVTLVAAPNSASPNQHRTSPLVHVAVIGSIVVLPYLVVRKQLTSLRRTVADMGAANAVMRRDMKTLIAESAVRQLGHQRVLSLLRETKESVEVLGRITEQRDAARLAVEERLEHDMHNTRQKLETLEADVLERDIARQDAEMVHHDELKALLKENQFTKAHLSTLKDLGTSLADIAAFMQEVEIKEGYASSKDDAHGIEKIRRLALKFMRSEKAEKADKAEKSPKGSKKSTVTADATSSSTADKDA